MKLAEAFGIQRGEIVAFVGAGGKTTTLARLAAELRAAGWRVLASTTTKIAAEELQLFPAAIPDLYLQAPHEISHLLTENGCVFLYAHLAGGKAEGISPTQISFLADHLDSDVILIEADGSRRLPLKAPYAHEPVIPPETSLVIPVAGLDAVGKPFNEHHVYNPEGIVEALGLPLNMPIQYPWIAQIVRELGLQGIPKSARVIPLLNRAQSTMRERLKTRRTAQQILLSPQVEAVAIANDEEVLEVQRRVGALVLAGGLSSRMGSSKPLLPWGKKTVIETILERLIPLRLAEILVVTGYEATKIHRLLHPIRVKSAFNRDYETGEMLSSLQTGLRSLSADTSACLVFLGDQPQVNPRVVNDILIAYAEGKGTIVAPSHQNRRGHPILIDRRYWRELLELPKGSAPRDLINTYTEQIAYVLTDDPNVLKDMDTPEDYQAALRRAGLI